MAAAEGAPGFEDVGAAGPPGVRCNRLGVLVAMADSMAAVAERAVASLALRILFSDWASEREAES